MSKWDPDRGRLARRSSSNMAKSVRVRCLLLVIARTILIKLSQNSHIAWIIYFRICCRSFRNVCWNATEIQDILLKKIFKIRLYLHTFDEIYQPCCNYWTNVWLKIYLLAEQLILHWMISSKRRTIRLETFSCTFKSATKHTHSFQHIAPLFLTRSNRDHLGVGFTTLWICN